MVTGWQLVVANARLHKLADPDAPAQRALETVDMPAAMDRNISTYSKGMKQRVKVATALVHDPEVLLLDEPFNGMDPRQRMALMALLNRLGQEGRTVLFSSHVLEEVEQTAGSIQVVVAGRLAASGGFREIRRLMTERPHQYTLRSSDNRSLAAAVIASGAASAVELSQGSGVDPGVLHVQAPDRSFFAHTLPVLAQRGGVRLYEVDPADESLESVFSYLVER